eukprot:11580833-Heterocapsa_arctica.AAC.1
MARWHCSLVWTPALRALGIARQQSVHFDPPLFPEWPPQDWLHRVLEKSLGALAARPGAPAKVRLTSAGLSQLANCLPRWSTDILHATPAEHE